MNGERRKPYKVRACTLKEEELAQLAEEMKKRYFCSKEIEDYVYANFHWKTNLERILDLLDIRGYLVGEEERKMAYGYKGLYKIFTKEEYEKIAEEHRENAKRRLLAAVSY